MTLSVQKSIPIEDIFLKKEKEDGGKRRGLDIEGKGVSYIQKIKKSNCLELTYILFLCKIVNIHCTGYSIQNVNIIRIYRKLTNNSCA